MIRSTNVMGISIYRTKIPDIAGETTSGSTVPTDNIKEI